MLVLKTVNRHPCPLTHFCAYRKVFLLKYLQLCSNVLNLEYCKMSSPKWLVLLFKSSFFEFNFANLIAGLPQGFVFFADRCRNPFSLCKFCNQTVNVVHFLTIIRVVDKIPSTKLGVGFSYPWQRGLTTGCKIRNELFTRGAQRIKKLLTRIISSPKQKSSTT